MQDKLEELDMSSRQEDDSEDSVVLIFKSYEIPPYLFQLIPQEPHLSH